MLSSAGCSPVKKDGDKRKNVQTERKERKTQPAVHFPAAACSQKHPLPPPRCLLLPATACFSSLQTHFRVVPRDSHTSRVYISPKIAQNLNISRKKVLMDTLKLGKTSQTWPEESVFGSVAEKSVAETLFSVCSWTREKVERYDWTEENETEPFLGVI